MGKIKILLEMNVPDDLHGQDIEDNLKDTFEEEHDDLECKLLWWGE